MNVENTNLNVAEEIPPALDPEILSSLPDEIDSSSWDRVKIKEISLQNFGRHGDVWFDFSDNRNLQDLICFVGPNGSGKTTVLSAIQLLFNNYTMYKLDRYRGMMTKYVRNFFNMPAGELEDSDFSITGIFTNGKHDYKVEVCRSGVKSWHPKEIARNLFRYCYTARFDKELNVFQIRRSKWNSFKKLFHSVTGFHLKEVKNPFDDTSDVRLKKLNDEYVTAFRVINKGEDVFTNRGMSAGERKITKCFSTIYNLPVQPSLILIDNITDHVETGRHLDLMSAMEDCFPDSQLICTCHSMPVQRNFDRSKIYDLRFLGLDETLTHSPWKVRLIDEIKDVISKVKFSPNVTNETKLQVEIDGERCIGDVLGVKEDESSIKDLIRIVEDFLSEIYKKYVVKDLMIHPPLKMRGR